MVLPDNQWIPIADFSPLAENAPGIYWAAWEDVWNVEIVQFNNLKWRDSEGVHEVQEPKWVYRLVRPQHPLR